MSTLKNTATGKDEKYLTDNYKEEQKTMEETPMFTENPPGNPPNGLSYSNVLRPNNDPYPRVARSTMFSIGGKDQKSIWNEGFSGSSIEELNAYRSQNQPNAIKALYALGGGVISGIGTFIEDGGYLLDYATYAAIFSDIDHSINEDSNWYRKKTAEFSEIGRSIKHSTESSIMPIYESIPEEDNYSDMLFRWSSMKSVVDSIVGFGLTGAAVGAGVKGVTKAAIKGITNSGKKAAARNARKLFLPMNNFIAKGKRLEAYNQFLMKTSPLYRNTIGSAGATVSSLFTKSAEARMEGLEAYENTLYEMQPLIGSNTITHEDAEKYANTAANEAFEYTMMTFIGDAAMLKGMFKSKGLVDKKLAAPTRWNRNKGLLTGAPIEGVEEMWQEAAKQEGSYHAFSQLKSELTNDEDLKKLKDLGHDPSQYSERWSERFLSYLGSTQALVSGTIGLLSGPAQAKLMSLSRRKENIKRQWEEYDAQQDIYKDNKKNFESIHKFKENAKQVALEKEMEEASQLITDSELSDIKEDAHITSIAATNFMNGTHENLKEIIKEEGSAQSGKLLAKIDILEKDFKAAKKFMNPNEMFVLNRAIKTTDRALKRIKEYRANPDLSKRERASYERSATKLSEALEGYKNEYDIKSSRAYQLDLADTESYAERMIKVLSEVSASTSITQLEAVKREFPEPSVIKAIDKRITELKNIDSSDKKSAIKKKSAEKTSNKSSASPSNSTSEGMLDTVASKKSGDIPLSKEETSFYLKNMDKVEEIINDKISNTETTPVDNEGTKYGGENNNMPIRSRDDIQENYLDNDYMQLIFDGLAQENDTVRVEVTQDMFDEFYDSYLSDIAPNTEDSASEGEALSNKIVEIYNKSANPETTQTTDTIANPKEGSRASMSGMELLDSLTDDVSEELPSKDPKDIQRKLQERQDKLFKFVEDVELETGKDLWSEGFKSIVTTLEELTGASVRPVYTRLKGIYMSITEIEVKENYDELLDIVDPDPGITATDMSPDKVKNNIEVAVKYVSPVQNSEQLQEIYSDSEVSVEGSKNRAPAESIAHLSQEYTYEYIGGKRVKRTDISEDISENTIINPNKYNSGDPVHIELDVDYNGAIRMESKNGELVPWIDILEASKSATAWEELQHKYKLPADSTIYDYWPLKITGTEHNEFIGHVHNTSWINSLTSAEDIIDNNKLLMKEFRKRVIDQLQADPTPYATSITEKVIEIHPEDGYYMGFALNMKTKTENAAESLPDTNLKIGIVGLGGIEIPGNNALNNHTMNEKFIDGYSPGTAMIYIPLAKKDGDMKYHASPLISTTLTPNQSRTARLAIEIFITQETSQDNGTLALYNANNKQGIDLMTKKGLNKFLRKIIVLHSPNKKENIPTIEKKISTRLGKSSLGIIESTDNSDVVKFGKSTVKTLKKGDRRNLNKTLNTLEDLVLPHMFFNVSKDFINSKETFNFTEIDVETNALDTSYEGSYNEFVKQHTDTFMRSTQTSDGEYSSTIQNITRFDMSSKKEVAEEREESFEEPIEVIEDTTDILQNSELIELSEKLGDEVTTWAAPIIEGDVTLKEQLAVMRTVLEADKHSNNYKC